MALILSIDTATEKAGICIAEDHQVLSVRTNNRQMDHASWIHKAIAEILQETGKNISAISAVAVTSGPGSYTGLRVGMATAKGFCYATGIPLLTENTLRLMAFAVREAIKNIVYPLPVLICPLLDARRMEVFTAAYDMSLAEKLLPGPLILDGTAFAKEMEDHTVVFSGNGRAKWQAICNHPNAGFSTAEHNVTDLAVIAAEKFRNSDFTDLVYSEPAYLKNVFTGKAAT